MINQKYETLCILTCIYLRNRIYSIEIEVNSYGRTLALKSYELRLIRTTWQLCN